jgi:hypothetical protein
MVEISSGGSYWQVLCSWVLEGNGDTVLFLVFTLHYQDVNGWALCGLLDMMCYHATGPKAMGSNKSTIK